MATSKSKTRRNLLIIALIVLAAGGTGAWVYFRKREVPVTVQTEKAARRNVTETVVATGKIQPVVQVVINPEVSGEIIDLPVKEGQSVNKGDLLLRIKPDNYIASRNSVAASYHSSLAGQRLAQANLDKAEIEFKRVQELFDNKLVSDSQLLDAKTTMNVMLASQQNSIHQVEQTKAALARADDDLAKTTIYSPTNGTVTKLKSQLGERVVGTAMMAGTEIMTVANLGDMEARVDIGEIDVVLIQIGQKAKLEVDSFRDVKFNGVVTEIANAAKASGLGTQQEATKFEVKIRLLEKEVFRPGMSVTSEVETRYRTNVLTVPIQSVTTRLPNDGKDKDKKKKAAKEKEKEKDRDELADADKKKSDKSPKAMEVVFEVKDGKAKTAKVKRGISDDSYVEILEGLTAGQEIVSGGYKAINRELEDGKAIKVDNEKKPFKPSDGKAP